MRKLVAALLLGAALVTTAVGCGPGSPSGTPPSGKKAS